MSMTDEQRAEQDALLERIRKAKENSEAAGRMFDQAKEEFFEAQNELDEAKRELRKFLDRIID